MMKLKLLPLCTQQPKTTSFRARTTAREDDVFKTINSVYFDPDGDSAETPQSWFTNSTESASTINELDASLMDSHLKDVIRGAQQSADHRFFFEPVGDSSSLVSDISPRLETCKNLYSLTPNKKKQSGEAVFDDGLELQTYQDIHSLTFNKQRQMKRVTPPPLMSMTAGVTMAVDSKDPYEDFKQSMKEMVESLGVRDDWEAMEELLGWYLKANDKCNHGYIICAFVDLLPAIVANNDRLIDQANSTTTSFSSAASSLSSSASTSSAPLLEEDSDHMIC